MEVLTASYNHNPLGCLKTSLHGSTNRFLHVCTFMILDSPTKWVTYLVSAWWGSIIILDRCTHSLSSGAIRACVPLVVTTM